MEDNDIRNTEERGFSRWLGKAEDTLNRGVRGMKVRWGLLLVVAFAVFAFVMLTRSVLYFFR